MITRDESMRRSRQRRKVANHRRRLRGLSPITGAKPIELETRRTRLARGQA